MYSHTEGDKLLAVGVDVVDKVGVVLGQPRLKGQVVPRGACWVEAWTREEVV